MPKIIKLNPKDKDTYLDSSEKFLLKFFNKPESLKTKAIERELRRPELTWPNRYHLAPQRHMLLNWYPFRKDSSLLEIGAGCGALTGLFLEKVDSIACNELSPSRAKVINNRFNDSKNLTIYVGDINELNLKQKYDYVTLIGVLEYAGKYSIDAKPYHKLLGTAKRLLKKDGHLLLAIENKLGLKYLTGAPEDHTGEIFDSIENYPQDKKIRTFSKEELTLLLEESGFSKTEFYFPWPDYKMPQIVFSEEGLKLFDQLTRSSIAQTVDFSHEFDSLYNEIALSYSLSKEHVLEKFANSFLVDAYE